MIEPQEGQTAYDVKEIYDDETGAIRMRQVRLNGKLHAPPNGEPSHAAFDKLGQPLLFEWHKTDLEHRAEGPASISFNPENGIHSTEVYKIEGFPRPKADGPHIVHRNEVTGEIVEVSDDEEWYQKRDRKRSLYDFTP